MCPELTVPLELSPSSRWQFTELQSVWAGELLRVVMDEIGGIGPYEDQLELFRENNLPDDLALEIEEIAKWTDCDPVTALAGNLYYDFIKALLGCTAFAVNAADGPLHARNMDWFSHSNCLSEFTTIMNFVASDGSTRFQSVSWPGFVGVLSGLAPGRFAVTLNAVLSDEPMQLGQSVALLLREVCETAPHFDAAVERLSRETCTSDFLLLVTGTEPGQMVVIERTPTRHAIRHAEGDFIVVSNDYRSLSRSNAESSGVIYETTCSRFDATGSRLSSHLPRTAKECFDILRDDNVRMSITVQQMVMSANTGLLEVITANGS